MLCVIRACLGRPHQRMSERRENLGLLLVNLLDTNKLRYSRSSCSSAKLPFTFSGSRIEAAPQPSVDKTNPPMRLLKFLFAGKSEPALRN